MKRVLVPIGLALCLSGLWVPRAFADTTTKPYAVDVDSPSHRRRLDPDVHRHTLERDRHPTARLSEPHGAGGVLDRFGRQSIAVGTATIVGSTIQLRGLNAPAGTSVTVSVVAISPCTPGDYPWAVIAKQANNFSGDPGNDLTFDAAHSNLVTTTTGTCSLGFGFLSQPKDAQVNTNITSQRYLRQVLPSRSRSWTRTAFSSRRHRSPSRSRSRPIPEAGC